MNRPAVSANIDGGMVWWCLSGRMVPQDGGGGGERAQCVHECHSIIVILSPNLGMGPGPEPVGGGL